MKRNRIIAAVLAAVLALSGCASENSKDKKDEKVVQKKKEKKLWIITKVILTMRDRREKQRYSGSWEARVR